MTETLKRFSAAIARLGTSLGVEPHQETFTERVSPERDDPGTVIHFEGRMIAQRAPNGELTFLEDIRRDELIAASDQFQLEAWEKENELTEEIERLKARVQELLEANVRFEREARKAKAWSKHLEANTLVLSSMLNLAYEKGKMLEKKSGMRITPKEQLAAKSGANVHRADG
ncbi:hypothetical protein HNR26_003832 [Rhizobium rosettiformans]|uniref:Ead/Ea22-like family protein n=2 Tax=Rhizobium rosettiformans TaxID=1368430 RepID=A0A4S8PER4_9HYPH|nr:hypothetical protein [Rhizobium rosettiformans]MBB5277743.1 hypothetical protein [Rhizobium rosettiformans]THV28928.1 hypothetical protein FAA86_23805 [Rhizobium rosettiformans W3]